MSPARPSWNLPALRTALILAVLAGLFSLAGGCAGPEGGSSLPWAQPEPWEQQPRLGVPM